MNLTENLKTLVSHVVYRPPGIMWSQKHDIQKESWGEKMPSCPSPWTWGWRLGWFFTVCLWSSHTLLFQSYLLSQILNIKATWMDISFIPLSAVIQLHLQADFCVLQTAALRAGPRVPQAYEMWELKFQTHSLCVRFNHGCTEMLARMGHSFFLAPVDLQQLPTQGPGVCVHISFYLPLASLHLPWPQAWGPPLLLSHGLNLCSQWQHFKMYSVCFPQ